MIRRTIVGTILIGILVLLASCGSPKGEPQDVLEKVSQKDLEKGHIKLQLMEKVSIDARVTPYEKYKNGLNIYYMEPYVENKDGLSITEFIRNPILFHQDMNQVTELIEKHSRGKFYMSKRKTKDLEDKIQLLIPFKCQSGKEMNINCWWDINDKGQVVGTDFNFCPFGIIDEYTKVGKGVFNSAPLYEERDFKFADGDTVAKEMRSLAEQITGRKISEDMYCVPISQELYDAVMDAQGEDKEELPYPGEYYIVIMYFDIDGFSWRFVNASMSQKNGMKLKDDVVVDNGELICKNEWPLVGIYSAEGVMGLELNSFLLPGKPYNEKQKVCRPNDIIEQIEAYFQNVLLKQPVTIYEISLVYDGYFTDPRDGIIENVIRPFWIVKYWDGEKALKLVFDAYTGKFISRDNAY